MAEEIIPHYLKTKGKTKIAPIVIVLAVVKTVLIAEFFFGLFERNVERMLPTDFIFS